MTKSINLQSDYSIIKVQKMMNIYIDGIDCGDHENLDLRTLFSIIKEAINELKHPLKCSQFITIRSVDHDGSIIHIGSLNKISQFVENDSC